LNPLVVDASVAAKWLLPPGGEPFADKAKSLLARYVNREIQIVVPDIFWAELANLLWKAARTARCTSAEALASLEAIRAQQFSTVASIHLAESALRIACQSDRTAYGALYVALAEELNGSFITADEKLANALAARYPVKWLGAQ